jgi:hypothetical protein
LPVRHLTRLIGLIFSILAALSVVSAHAQSDEWSQRDTSYFAILHAPDAQAEAERYAGFADGIYDEVTGALGHRVATPITLRLYPDLESYYVYNPRARGMSGIVAHADFRHNEVVVIVSQTASQSEDEVVNNVRHELAHIIASDLSENRLNAGFQEGLAQYFEHPTPALDAKIAILQQAYQQGQLLPWSTFDDRDIIYNNPEISYPETLSVVTFLAQRSSSSQLRDFLSISATSSGYRSALQRAFGATPDDLEQEWLAWLPNYVNGGYRLGGTNEGYDLARAEELLRTGMYADAQRELEAVVAGLDQAGRTDEAAYARSLIERSRAGLQAEELAQQSRAALEATDYEQAATLALDAQAAYQAIDDTRQADVLAEYIYRAERGRRAGIQLAEALSAAETYRYPQARVLADRAAADYTALGDQVRAAQALELRSFVDQRQSLIGGVLVLLGAGGAAISLARRMMTPEVEPW